MLIFPAIDLYEGNAVRLYKGDYAQMTVYSSDPAGIARDFAAQGAQWIHVVDLEGARNGETPNIGTVRAILKSTPLSVEIGGGIRSIEVIEKYLSAGVSRVILGTAAVTDPVFLHKAAEKYGEKIAVGVDVREGFVAVKGWTEQSNRTVFGFCDEMQQLGIRTIICTDISKDGAMQGTNRDLYLQLRTQLKMDIIASGGVSTLEDVRALREMGLYGAIIGKAYYTGAISLKEAIEVGK